MKAALVVGHNRVRPGAHAVRPLDESEYPYWSGVAEKVERLMAKSATIDVSTFYREARSSYSREIRLVYGQVDTWRADLSIELHFNAAGPTATGTETLSSGTRGSMAVAEVVQSEMVDTLQLRDRGIKVRSRSERGGKSLWAGRAPAVLIEPFFGSNVDDVRRAVALGKDGMAEMICRILRRL